MTDTARFYKYVNKLDSCWLWTAAVDKHGYGRFWWNGRTGRAARFALEQKLRRVLLPTELACHSCDVPACVRAEHLFAGSTLDNIQDAVRKGRFNHLQAVRIEPHGEENGNHKLTEYEVREIRARYRPGRAPHASPTALRALAVEYGVSKFAIQYVLKTGWAHVTS